MNNKRVFGQYYTTHNPFDHILFKEWVELFISDINTVIEPFAGSNNIPYLLQSIGYNFTWKCYDIEPGTSVVNELNIEKRDTINNFPNDSTVSITNPPYLCKSSARRRKIDYPWQEDDLYKVCLSVMLENCDYVAAIIPESFITSNFHFERLWGIISLPYKMFDDTECPVCLAMFSPNGKNGKKIFSGNDFLGTIEELTNHQLMIGKSYNNWRFNDKRGTIGVKTVDSKKCADCHFFDGNEINDDDVKDTNRAFSKIYGLPFDVDKDLFIKKCNDVLNDYRAKTKDVTMTSFKGLRKDGKYRRRLDFATVRHILDFVLIDMENYQKLF